MAGKRGRNLVIPFAVRRIEQLAPLLSIDNANAQLLTTSTAFSGTLRFPFQVSFHAFDSSPGTPVHSPIRRSGEQHQYLISCSRDSCSHYQVALVANELNHLKNLVAFYRSLGNTKSICFTALLQEKTLEELNIELTKVINN